MLSGQKPFHGKHPEVIKRLARDGEQLERPLWTSIPDHPVWEMIERCRAFEPTERPNLSDVRGCLDSSPTDLPERWPSPPTSDASGSPLQVLDFATNSPHPAPLSTKLPTNLSAPSATGVVVTSATSRTKWPCLLTEADERGDEKQGLGLVKWHWRTP